MIKRRMTIQPVLGKGLEASQLMQEIKEYFDKKYPQTATEIYSERYDSYGTLHISQQFESLVDMEKIREKYEADEDVQNISTNDEYKEHPGDPSRIGKSRKEFFPGQLSFCQTYNKSPKGADSSGFRGGKNPPVDTPHDQQE